MRIPLVVSLLTIVGCSTSTTSSDIADTSVVSTDTMAMAFDPAEGTDETYEEARDTTYTLDVHSAFAGPQFNDRLAYVYSVSGLDVFESPDMKKVVGHIDYKGRVELTEGLINNLAQDTMTMAALKGHLVSITHEGKQAYIFSGYLVNLPVPEDGTVLVDYFATTLHIITPAVRSATECECDMMSSSETFEYENGITLKTGSYYEGGGHSVTFKNKMTFQEVFLFASHFYHRMAREVPELPKEAFEVEKDGPVNIKVSAKGGSITEIVVNTAEGCVEDEGIYKADDHILMSSSEGC